MAFDRALETPSRAMAPAILLSALMVGGTLVAMLAPPARGETTVVFAPGTSEAEAWARISAAGGYVVGPAALPFAVVAYAPDTGFAWDVLTRGGLSFSAQARLCGPEVT